MFSINLIGIAPGAGLDQEAREILSRCGCVLASSRHCRLVSDLDIEVLPITPLASAVNEIESRLEVMNVAVLASGDPLFFGIGRTLIERFGPDRLSIRPALSSLQAAMARFKEPWDHAKVISLHGRNTGFLASRLLPHAKVCCFTDQTHSPAVVARTLLDACLALGDQELANSYRVWVAENLGDSRERIFAGSLADTAATEFAELNVMLLKRAVRPALAVTFGLSEAEIAHSRGLITKDEIRAATLHLLRLPPQGVLWDVGAGSGSVGLEAARLCPDLSVYAVEKNQTEIKHIRANCRQFEIYNLIAMPGEAPLALAGLPDPDRVFIGGSGGRLAEIIAAAADRLPIHGRLVVNGVTEQTKKIAPELMQAQGLRVTVSEITIQRRTYPEGRATTLNPIAIMVGEK